MDLIEAILVAVIQGATELFPVSSLGHAVVLPAVLNLSLDEKAPEFLPFLVLLHTGTASALLLFFWRDWWLLLTGVLGLAAAHQRRESRRVLLRIIVATIPAVIVGFLLEKFLLQCVLPSRQPFLMCFLPGLALSGILCLILLRKLRFTYGQAFFDAHFFCFGDIFPGRALFGQLLPLPRQLIAAAGDFVVELRLERLEPFFDLR